ncbi:GIY-YIG nuclease family protein [Deinococcus enclensis]|uniref:Bacteriophage T5 Orf172 DNA-binding domain-containing protein n=1 Tax=Deinococcus enclensis TaxID=1049582 RepID=A0ABT9MHV5_9DEIO|nr:GIY-YIG nuclease family protein [Deinococcus enclensis]MDP9766165.1 hypothetical protein [Deinococcus enclensis]
MSGYVYIASNPSLPGLLKIGHTKRNPFERIGELYTTGLPTRFELILALAVTDSAAVEILIHQELQIYRVEGNREFFRISIADAVRCVLLSSKDFHVDFSEPIDATRETLNPILQRIGEADSLFETGELQDIERGLSILRELSESNIGEAKLKLSYALCRFKFQDVSVDEIINLHYASQPGYKIKQKRRESFDFLLRNVPINYRMKAINALFQRKDFEIGFHSYYPEVLYDGTYAEHEKYILDFLWRNVEGVIEDSSQEVKRRIKERNQKILNKNKDIASKRFKVNLKNLRYDSEYIEAKRQIEIHSRPIVVDRQMILEYFDRGVDFGDSKQKGYAEAVFRFAYYYKNLLATNRKIPLIKIRNSYRIMPKDFEKSIYTLERRYMDLRHSKIK